MRQKEKKKEPHLNCVVRKLLSLHFYQSYTCTKVKKSNSYTRFLIKHPAFLYPTLLFFEEAVTFIDFTAYFYFFVLTSLKLSL